MLEKAQAYEARLSGLRADARRLFPAEISGFPAATRRLVEQYQLEPKTQLLAEEMLKAQTSKGK
jgi:hypothetical protein